MGPRDAGGSHTSDLSIPGDRGRVFVYWWEIVSLSLCVTSSAPTFSSLSPSHTPFFSPSLSPKHPLLTGPGSYRWWPVSCQSLSWDRCSIFPSGPGLGCSTIRSGVRVEGRAGRNRSEPPPPPPPSTPGKTQSQPATSGLLEGLGTAFGRTLMGLLAAGLAWK